MGFVDPGPLTCLSAPDDGDDAAAVGASVVDDAGVARGASDTESTYLLVAHRVIQGYCSRSSRWNPC